MIAEWQASIEGRLYFESKQNPPSHSEDIAERELKENGTQVSDLREFPLSSSLGVFPG